MSWNNDDGPWGPFSGKNNDPASPKKDDTPKAEKPEPENPWARKMRNRGSSPQGQDPQQPDFDEMMRRARELFDQYGNNGTGKIVFLAIAGLFALWLASGIYQVGTDQMGVVMRFGAFARTEGPGLRYHLPAPIEEVLLPVVTSQNEIQIGFRRGGRSGEPKAIPEESLMLTQDENIVNVQFTVFWRINDVQKFLFEVRNPQQTIKMAAESAMREVIGQNKLQFALTDGRSAIAEETRTRLQALMDEYNGGVMITQINLQTVAAPDEVKAAFQDVVNARLDQEKFQNQAAAHVNKVIPDAKGQAAQIMQQAMAYRDQKIAIAEGEAARFKSIQSAYSVSKDVTSKRLYLETMESVLGGAQKVVIDKDAGGSVPFFPLRDFSDRLKTSSDKN